MSKTHKIKETRLWTCEYEIEIEGFLSDEDINEAISMAWQTNDVYRWFVFNTQDGREGRVRKLSREVYDKDKSIKRLNETEKEFDRRMKWQQKNDVFKWAKRMAKEYKENA